jgi:hypothetical protein
MIPSFDNRIRKVCPLVAATLILSCTAQAAPRTQNVNVVNAPNVNVANTTTNPVPVTGTVGVANSAAV